MEISTYLIMPLASLFWVVWMHFATQPDPEALAEARWRAWLEEPVAPCEVPVTNWDAYEARVQSMLDADPDQHIDANKVMAEMVFEQKREARATTCEECGGSGFGRYANGRMGPCANPDCWGKVCKHERVEVFDVDQKTEGNAVCLDCGKALEVEGESFRVEQEFGQVVEELNSKIRSGHSIPLHHLGLTNQQRADLVPLSATEPKMQRYESL